MKPHKKLVVWQQSMNLVEEIYKLTQKFPKGEMYGLVQQMRRCVISIPSNIAEGTSRKGKKEMLQFLSVARSSLSELDTQIDISYRLGYISESSYKNVSRLIENIDILLNGLLKHCRNKLLVFFFTFSLFHFLTFSLSYGAFQNTDWSVRAESMGGVFTAVSDEPQGMFYNPAGIAAVEQNCIQLYYCKPFLGVEDVDFNFSNFAVVLPIKIVSLGCGYGMMNVNNLYTESIFILSVGNTIRKIYTGLPSIQLGLNLKLLTKSYNFNNEILYYEPKLKTNSSQQAVSADFGVIYKMLKDKLSLGFVVKDIIKPNIAVVENEVDNVPSTVQLGSVYNFGDVSLGKLYLEDLSLGIELRYRDQFWGDTGTKIFYAVGAETYLNFRTIALRFGINKNSVNLGFGYYGIKLVKKVSLGINYSFGISTVVTDSIGNHRLSLEIKY